MTRAVSVLLVFVMFAELCFAGVGSNEAKYIGGTAPLAKDKEAALNVSDPTILSFADWTLPYAKITALSYGQHAGRRVGTTVALGVTTLGIGALPVLFSKKRRHYLTVEYTDDKGAQQAAVFEVGKDAIRTVLKSLEVRTGKKMEYEDEEARKAGNK